MDIFLIKLISAHLLSDLKEAQDLRLTEYVLIGTLLSFWLAIAASLIIKILLF